MSRNERLYLTEIIDAPRDIEEFLGGRSRDDCMGDKLLRSGVLLHLINIGEAAAHISSELKARHPEIPWRQVIAFRNIAVHEYFAVDWAIVWTTATRTRQNWRGV